MGIKRKINQKEIGELSPYKKQNKKRDNFQQTLLGKRQHSQ